MGEKIASNRVFSIFIIFSLFISVLFGATLLIPINTVAAGTGSWTENSDADFKKGTLTDVEIVGSGSAAELILKSNFSGNWLEKPRGGTPDPRRGHALASIYGTDKVLLFGGWASSYLDDTWVYDLSDNKWTEMKPAVKPGPRHSHTMASIYGKDKVLLFGGYKSSTAANNETWVYDLSDDNWTLQSPATKPIARAYHGLASVDNDDKIVLFGGYYITTDTYLNDTWVYDLSTDSWTNKSPLNAPSPRKGHEMANIYKTKEILLFAGNETGTKFVDDTWIYNLTSNTWTKKTISGSKPSARRGHGMAAIDGTKKVMIFGPDDQTWVYDVSANLWSNKSPAAKPIGRYITHGIAPIYGDDEAVLFGGGYNSGGWVHLSDTWVFDLSANNWTIKTSTMKIKPSVRRGHVLASIHGTDNVVLFGGWNGNYLDDTWVYDLSNDTWTEMKPLTKSGGRHSHAMASIYGTDKVVLFGGSTSGGVNGETWVYDLSANVWTNKTPIMKPSTREYHAMASVHNDDKVVLFGGYNSSGYKYDTWVYDISDNKWTKKSPTTSPSGRKGHEMANVYGTDKIVLFGGNDGSKNLDDTWIYNTTGNTWTKQSPTSKPTPRRGHGTAAIHGTDKVMLFGPDDQTWLYDLSDKTWSKNSPVTKPTGRYISHGIAPFYGTDKAVMFGGGGSSGDLDDTWVYNAFKYSTTGTYTSSSHNIGSNTTLKQIMWNSTTPTGTSIKLQLRSATNASGLSSKSFVGSDGKTTSYYTTSPSNLWSGHKNDNWIQYKVYFTTTDEEVTPVLKNVTITHNSVPKTYLSSPVDNAILTDNTPTFAWEFEDGSGGFQTAFLVEIGTDIGFIGDIYASGEQISTNHFWNFPEGASFTELPDGEWYWRVRTRDNDGEWGGFSSLFKFTIDTYSPISEITVPNNLNYYSDINQISGIASDDGGTGTDKVEILLKNGQNKFWSGSTWVAEETWVTVSGTSEWIYDTSKLSWLSGVKYVVSSRAIDIASNTEIPDDSIEFYIDTDAPISIINSPQPDSLLNELTTISGSATDSGSGIAKVELRIKDNANNQYWDGTTWADVETWLATTGVSEWSYEIENEIWISDVQYSIASRALDIVGNLENPEPVVNFMFDDQPPILLFKINDGEEFTKSKTLTLSIETADTGSGNSRMSVKVDDQTWSTWEPATDSKSIELPDGDGERAVSVRVKDQAENIADPVTESIILDTTPPHSLSIALETGSTETATREVNLKLTADDATSGVSQMSFSTDGETWGNWEHFATKKYYILSTGDGEKTIYFRVKDHAGNIAEAVSLTITLKTQIQVVDTDKDGIPDDEDAFPTDPAASVDTDGDGYPNYWNDGMSQEDSVTGLILDAYPDDPDRYLKSSDSPDESNYGFIILGAVISIITLIILLGLISSIILRNKRQRMASQIDEDKILNELKQDIIHGENQETLGLSSSDLNIMLDNNFETGELSNESIEYIRNIIEEND